jgi:hypothetical protein
MAEDIAFRFSAISAGWLPFENRRHIVSTTVFCRLAGTGAVLAAWLLAPGAARSEDSIRLTERFAPGYRYHVSVRVELAGTMTLPADERKPAPSQLSLNGDSAIEYDERVLDVDKNGVVLRTARLCRRTDFHRTISGQSRETSLRPAVRRLVILRRNNIEVPFSPDGALSWEEIDLIRTDVFTPALTGLFPGGPVRPGDRWTASDGAVRELTDLERIDEGKVDCQLEQVTTVEGKRQARVTLAGTVRGLNEDGPNRQVLEGYFHFDLESNHLSYLYLKGVHVILGKDGREIGRVEGRFVMTRQANTGCPELSDDGLKGVAVDPDANNTLLLYDNPDLGIRFLYPRRWRVASVRGMQISLDGADGNGVLLTLDPPARVPSGTQFLAESRSWLVKQRAALLREEPVRKLQETLEGFALEAELSGQRFLMDYYVARQPAGGVTVAARLVPADREAARRELEKLARSVTISQPSGKNR